MQITIDTTTPLSDTDYAVLALLISGTDTPAATVVTEPAKKPATKPATKPKPEPEPEPEPEEDLIGDGPTVQDAIDKATELVNEGKQALVKAALKAVGADRVSNIPASKAADFLAELEG